MKFYNCLDYQFSPTFMLFFGINSNFKKNVFFLGNHSVFYTNILSAPLLGEGSMRSNNSCDGTFSGMMDSDFLL